MHYQKHFWANIYSAVMICTLVHDRDRDVFVVNSDDVHSHFAWFNYILDSSKFTILRLILPNSRPFLITGKKTREAASAVTHPNG